MCNSEFYRKKTDMTKYIYIFSVKMKRKIDETVARKHYLYENVFFTGKLSENNKAFRVMGLL